MTLTDIAKTNLDKTHDDENEALAATTIYVCITCRRASDPDGGNLPTEGKGAAEGTPITVQRVRCLANCSRALSAAMRRDGGWAYVFGGLDERSDAEALIQGAKLFAHAPDGLMPWRGRPEVLKRGLIARVPPIDFPEESE